MSTGTDPYPDNSPDTAVDKPAVVAGAAVIFSGTGFWPYEVVNITLDYATTAPAALGGAGAERGGFTMAELPVPKVAITSIPTDATGSFSVSINLAQAGTAVLTAVGAQSGHTQTQTVTVTAAPAATAGSTSSATLAVTGLNPRVGTEVIGGVAAVTVGAFLVWLAFRARRRGSFEA